MRVAPVVWKRRAAVSLAILLSAASVRADEIIVPNRAAGAGGTGGYSTLLHSQERSYQLVVGPQELSGLPVGSRITAITWRLMSWQVQSDWPGMGRTARFDNYDIYLSSSLNPPGSLSRNYLENIGPDVVLARGGPFTFADVFFPGGALLPATNPFGENILFAEHYVYQGGDLLLTIRHTGNVGASSGYLDTLSSPYAQAIGVSSYTQTGEWYNQGLIVMRLTFTPPATCPADLNGDGVIDLADLGILLADFGCTAGPGNCPGDIDNDGDTDLADLGILLSEFGNACP